MSSPSHMMSIVPVVSVSQMRYKSMTVASVRTPGNTCPLRKNRSIANDWTNASPSVKKRVYCVIFCCPVSPSLASSCSLGIATVINCITIEAVMYGMIPRAKTLRLLNAPPVNTPKRPVIAFPLVSRPLSRASRFTPGSGTQQPSRYRIRIAAVNMSLRLSSGTLQAFPKAFSISPLQDLDATASCHYLLFGNLREGVRPHRNGPLDLPVPEDLDQVVLPADHPRRLELLDADLVPVKLRKLTHVDRRVELGACGCVRPARHALETRQPTLQRHLAALVGQVRLRIRAGLGAPVAAAAGLAVPRACSSSDPLAVLFRAAGRTEFVQPHYSSTSSTSTR